MNRMDYDHLAKLKQHPAWRLLMADHAPFIIAFFYHVFISPGIHSYSQSELTAKLEDYLFYVRSIAGENVYPRAAQEYLDDWAHNNNGYLRKYYPERGDDPCFDLTPASEKAIEWLRGLEQKSFVGTESRLLTIFQLLREIVHAVQTDPELRMAELRRQRFEIDAQIERLQQGKVDVHDPTKIKERYYEIAETARRLLADFRQVEENFRQLDRRTREKIATSLKSKGELLDEIFGEEDAISASDQGRSFRAFWEFLMLAHRQEELEGLLNELNAIKEIQGLEKDNVLPSLKYRLMEAGEKVQKTTSSLVGHLRRFLDDQVWLDNKRIMDLVRSIEKTAVELRDASPSGSSFMSIDDVRPSIDLPMARGLYVLPGKGLVSNVELVEGEGVVDNDSIYQIHYVDEQELKDRIWRCLEEKNQVSLGEICSCFPIEKGLSELLTYLNIAGKDQRAAIGHEARETITWHDSNGRQKKAMVPRVIFTRQGALL